MVADGMELERLVVVGKGVSHRGAWCLWVGDDRSWPTMAKRESSMPRSDAVEGRVGRWRVEPDRAQGTRRHCRRVGWSRQFFSFNKSM